MKKLLVLILFSMIAEMAIAQSPTDSVRKYSQIINYLGGYQRARHGAAKDSIQPQINTYKSNLSAWVLRERKYKDSIANMQQMHNQDSIKLSLQNLYNITLP